MSFEVFFFYLWMKTTNKEILSNLCTIDPDSFVSTTKIQWLTTSIFFITSFDRNKNKNKPISFIFHITFKNKRLKNYINQLCFLKKDNNLPRPGNN